MGSQVNVVLLLAFELIWLPIQAPARKTFNAPASRLKKSCRGLKSNFLSYALGENSGAQERIRAEDGLEQADLAARVGGFQILVAHPVADQKIGSPLGGNRLTDLGEKVGWGLKQIAQSQRQR